MSRPLFLVLLLVTLSHCCDDDDSSEALGSGANDVMVVRQRDGSLKATPLQVQIGKFDNWRTMLRSRKGRHVTIEINGILAPVKLTVQDSGSACFTRRNHQFTLTDSELQGFDLKKGINQGVYRLDSLKVEIRFLVYLFDQTDKFVVTDIDGTITSSDISGRVSAAFGFKGSHSGVTKLFDRVVTNGYAMIYLTGRSMAEDEDTRHYLFETLDHSDGGHSLPFGPLFMSPKTVAESLLDIVKGAEIQKTATLSEVTGLLTSGPEAIMAAFGNKESDSIAYLNVGIPRENIYLADPSGKVVNLANVDTPTNYLNLADQVDSLFPPRQQY